MDPVLTEENGKLRREKSKEAIALALGGDWERAIEANQEILGLFPKDVESLNRLGKAFLGLGRYPEARGAFEAATRIAPHNTISKKNLERLDHLEETSPPPQQGKVVTPYLLIEESGKSLVTVLHNPAERQMLAKVAAGDTVRLEARDNALLVLNNQGEYLGQVVPKRGMRLVRLMLGGNRYSSAVISVNRQDISVIIWEAYRHPDLISVCSFPSRSKEDYKVYLRDASLRYDIASGLEEDGFASEWKERYPDATVTPNGEEPSDGVFGEDMRPENPMDDEE